eukprot:TRINITY_DN9255_c0_g1_i1.p1 TRINITY_DN9255_c0_g1~~TRINITY_DN9255_c0_g1_i1.p1  ORF type:complete len:171 (-),score=32.90 TRINITY_DN9255_c0_g1_i1:86-541(-)
MYKGKKTVDMAKKAFFVFNLCFSVGDGMGLMASLEFFDKYILQDDFEFLLEEKLIDKNVIDKINSLANGTIKTEGTKMNRMQFMMVQPIARNVAGLFSKIHLYKDINAKEILDNLKKAEKLDEISMDLDKLLSLAKRSTRKGFLAIVLIQE